MVSCLTCSKCRVLEEELKTVFASSRSLEAQAEKVRGLVCYSNMSFPAPRSSERNGTWQVCHRMPRKANQVEDKGCVTLLCWTYDSRTDTHTLVSKAFPLFVPQWEIQISATRWIREHLEVKTLLPRCERKSLLNESNSNCFAFYEFLWLIITFELSILSIEPS